MVAEEVELDVVEEVEEAEDVQEDSLEAEVAALVVMEDTSEEILMTNGIMTCTPAVVEVE